MILLLKSPSYRTSYIFLPSVSLLCISHNTHPDCMDVKLMVSLSSLLLRVRYKLLYCQLLKGLGVYLCSVTLTSFGFFLFWSFVGFFSVLYKFSRYPTVDWRVVVSTFGPLLPHLRSDTSSFIDSWILRQDTPIRSSWLRFCWLRVCSFLTVLW